MNAQAVHRQHDAAIPTLLLPQLDLAHQAGTDCTFDPKKNVQNIATFNTRIFSFVGCSSSQVCRPYKCGKMLAVLVKLMKCGFCNGEQALPDVVHLPIIQLLGDNGPASPFDLNTVAYELHGLNM